MSFPTLSSSSKEDVRDFRLFFDDILVLGRAILRLVFHDCLCFYLYIALLIGTLYFLFLDFLSRPDVAVALLSVLASGYFTVVPVLGDDVDCSGLLEAQLLYGIV